MQERRFPLKLKRGFVTSLGPDLCHFGGRAVWGLCPACWRPAPGFDSGSAELLAWEKPLNFPEGGREDRTGFRPVGGSGWRRWRQVGLQVWAGLVGTSSWTPQPCRWGGVGSTYRWGHTAGGGPGGQAFLTEASRCVEHGRWAVRGEWFRSGVPTSPPPASAPLSVPWGLCCCDV